MGRATGYPCRRGDPADHGGGRAALPRLPRWGTGLRAASAQRALSRELNQEWRQGPVRGDAVGASPERFDVATGQPFAFIRIPAFGKQWRYTLIQGTALAQLNVSPGHVPGTQWPGQLGNFAVAGHRVTGGNPFWSLPSMKDGDLVYVQTRLNNYTYRVIGKQWVSPTDTAVLDPVPGHPRQRPNRRLISLITCDPAWTGTHRVIVTGVLVASQAPLDDPSRSMHARLDLAPAAWPHPRAGGGC